MKLSEEKEIKKITNDFTAAIKAFNLRDYKKSLENFEKIENNYNNSEFLSVLEIVRKTMSYANICRSELTPVTTKPKTDEDYINEIVFSLNENDLNQADKYFSTLSKKKFSSPFFDYLRSIYFLKNNETDKSLEWLEKCIKADSLFKISANNEPDFEPLFEDPKFNEIIE
jgi:hypothetical protein